MNALSEILDLGATVAEATPIADVKGKGKGKSDDTGKGSRNASLNGTNLTSSSGGALWASASKGNLKGSTGKGKFKGQALLTAVQGASSSGQKGKGKGEDALSDVSSNSSSAAMTATGSERRGKGKMMLHPRIADHFHASTRTSEEAAQVEWRLKQSSSNRTPSPELHMPKQEDGKFWGAKGKGKGKGKIVQDAVGIFGSLFG